MDTEELREKISNMSTEKELYKEFCVILSDIEYSLLHDDWETTLGEVRRFYTIYNDLYFREV